MALKRLSYYRKYLNLDMTFLLKTNIAYSGIIIGLRERDLVFHVKEITVYKVQGLYNVIERKMKALLIIYIHPYDITVYRLGKEPPLAYLAKNTNRSPKIQPIQKMLCGDQPQGSNTTSLDIPHFALPAENRYQEPNASQESNGVSQETNIQENNILETGGKTNKEIEENCATIMTDEFQTNSDAESDDSLCQSVLEPRSSPSTSNCASLNTTKINRFGKNTLVERYEMHRKYKLLQMQFS